jgi:DNA-binding response OmpR family regulator
VTVRFGAFVIDSGRRQLTRNGVEVHLTPKAFDLLVLLVEESPRVIRKDELHARLSAGAAYASAKDFISRPVSPRSVYSTGSLRTEAQQT